MSDYHTENNTDLVAVPWQSLSDEALLGLLEEYISRAGTDYGLEELTLDQKVRRAKTELEAGHVVIVVDLKLESTHIVSIDEYNQSTKENSKNDEN